MNILVLNNTSDLYGGSKIMSIVVQILQEGNHKPIVVLSETGPLVTELNRMGVPVAIIRLGILRRKYLSIPGILNRIKVTRQAWKKLNQLIDEKNIDLIYSNTTGVFIGAFLARKRKLKHIWHVHEIITKPKIFTTGISHLLGRYSDKIIVVSNAVKTHWQKHLPGKEITLIYNGINTVPFENPKQTLREELGIEAGQLLICMIGRVNHWKGQNYFIDIAKNILAELPDTHFVMAGDAYPGNEHLVIKLQERIASEKLSSKVHYLGYRTDTPNILASANIFVLPSTLPDPFPTVILEAMAAARPVIATRHGGALEMIADHETGLLIPFNDPDAAAREMITLIKAGKLEQMGLNGRDRIQKLFSLDAFKKSILKNFEEVFSPHAS